MGKTPKLSTKPSTAPPAVPAEAAAATPQAATPGEAAATPQAAGGGTTGATGNTPACGAPPGGIVPVDAAATRPVGADIGSVGAFIGSVCGTARAAAPTGGAATGAAPTGTTAATGTGDAAAAVVANAGATTSIPTEAVTAAVPAGNTPAAKDPFKVTEMDEKKLLTFYKYIIGGVDADVAGNHAGFEPAGASKLAELIMAKASAMCPMTESGRHALQIVIEEIKEREIGRDAEAIMAFLEANAVDVELAEL